MRFITNKIFFSKVSCLKSNQVTVVICFQHFTLTGKKITKVGGGCLKHKEIISNLKKLNAWLVNKFVFYI